MSEQSRSTLILVAAIVCGAGALVVAGFRARAIVTRSSAKSWHHIAVLAICGVVVTASYEVASHAWQLLSSSR